MIRFSMLVGALSAVLINLAGCERQAAMPADGPTSPPSPVIAPTAPAPSATPTAEVSEPAAPSAARDPAEVLGAWARAVEARDWRTVRSYWGERGTRSGMDEAAFAAHWADLLAPQVSIGTGLQEGAAGTLYYSAPVTITDGERTVRGNVTMRRSNDVPGATAEQLRWHIEDTTLNW
jgi:hypothetical protein